MTTTTADELINAAQMTLLNEDMTRRWTPSREQDEAAHAKLAELRDREAGRNPSPPSLYTVQLLVNKARGIWRRDVEVLGLPGLCWSRGEALAAADAAIAVHQMLRPGAEVSASYTVHELPTGENPGQPGWKTTWSLFEA